MYKRYREDSVLKQRSYKLHMIMNKQEPSNVSSNRTSGSMHVFIFDYSHTAVRNVAVFGLIVILLWNDA